MTFDPIARGATVHLSFIFRDEEGEVVTPTGASVYLNYRNLTNGRSSTTIALTESSGEWVATWDSRVAHHGEVFGHARSSAPLPLSATDFTFRLVANPSNPR